MTLAITINQSGKSAGVAGQAREDLDTGTAVSVASSGGPFLAYEWTFIAKPIDIVAGAQATSLMSTPTATSTLINPIDVAGTYEVQLAVDSGSGLGALDTDVVRITFFAGAPGVPLNPDPAELPRRGPAFSEMLEHNVPDVIEPSGNTQGWSREWFRWFAAIFRMWQAKSYAHGRIANDGVTATVVNAMNATPERLDVGQVRITFARDMPTDTFVVIATARGIPGGSCSVRDEGATGFVVERADAGGSLVDADFCFDVKYTP